MRREWLVTNGLGGFGSGTIAGCQTRRYHGLLIAAERPPLGRTLYLVDLDATVDLAGVRYELACHEYEGGVVNPLGFLLLESFCLEGTVPTWVYALGPARLIKRVFMAPARNTTYVCYMLQRSLAPLQLKVRALCTGRDYHSQRRSADGYQMQTIAGGCHVTIAGMNSVLSVTADRGQFRAAPDMHWRLHHRLEAARGLDSTEDLYMPGEFDLVLSEGESVNFTATVEAASEPAAIARQRLQRHEAELSQAITAASISPPPPWIRQLALAAGQYVVTRHGTADGKSIIAGYPWFTDWGRDTMIALPGLTLATGRAPIAADILRTFAQHVDQGLLPNRFPDSGEAPEYNTVDATLWYFVAVHEYLRATNDIAFAREIYPVLADIVDWHRRGTRHGIVVDDTDGLLRCGASGLQLTWMDAKVEQWVVTPRIGKPVEINALWYNALRIIAQIATQLGDSAPAQSFNTAAHAACDSFRSRFWFEDGQYLYDVIDGPQVPTIDDSLRPNQLLALSLPYRMLEDARARLVLRTCERALLTSYGPRTLNPQDARYVSHYRGDQRQRDGAYHQGTVWPWLLGAFVRAHFALYGNRPRAASYLTPLQKHLEDACVGQISEIFDAEPPHAPQGCIAQAWSVAEILHTWQRIHSAQERTDG